MQWSDAKYLIAYIAPAAAFIAVHWGGYWSLSAVFIAFGAIPLLELVLPGTAENLEEEEELQKKVTPFFDWLLYLNIPILIALLGYYFYNLTTVSWTSWEIAGISASMGVVMGTIGINVAHELGHRHSTYERWMAKILLLCSLYMHFTIEHNKGHHKNVATDADPASARLGESLYAFWWRSINGSYWHAWQLEAQWLEQANLPFWSWHNQMLRFQLMQLVYLGTIALIFGWLVMLFAILIAGLGILLLETVNYIEHYGLRRRRLANGRYEPVSPKHSWNSNHELGRIFLYELTPAFRSSF